MAKTIASAVDPAWVAADQVILSGSCHDGLEQAVSLGNGDPPERARGGGPSI